MIALLTALILCQAPTDPPTIVYGASRSSTDWISLPSGTNVPVDRGIEWRGVKVYLSLMNDLIAVEAASGEVKWNRMVGGFWNEVGFEEIELAGGEKRWAVSLRPGPSAARGKDLVKYHDLQTGEELVPRGADGKPRGRPFEPRVWSGESSRLDHRFRVWITTEKNWRTFRAVMFGKEPAALGDVDFEHQVLLAISYGDAINCLGIRAVEAYEDETRILLRIRNRTVQSGPEGIRARPYGIFVLPRTDKTYVIERDVQGYIAGPPIWQELLRVEKLPDPAGQLREVLRPV